MNAIECPEFRDLILYLNSNLTDADIPHRTKITEYIFELFSEQYRTLVEELQVRAL